MTVLSERPFPGWTPYFGERLVTVFVAVEDPVRFVTFVRVYRSGCKLQWEVTDECGSFWLVNPRAMERPATVGGAGHRGVCPCCNQRLTTDQERTNR